MNRTYRVGVREDVAVFSKVMCVSVRSSALTHCTESLTHTRGRKRETSVCVLDGDSDGLCDSRVGVSVTKENLT